MDPEKILPPGTAEMDFVEDIGPIFERSCIRCHNSDRRGQFGAFRVGFRLDLGRDVAMEDEGIIVPGKSEKSRLIRHVVRLDTPMPPREKDRLSSEEIGKLRAWIDQGAVWPKSTHRLPEGYRLVNRLVKEEFPTEGNEKSWAELVKKYESKGLKVNLRVSEKKKKMFLGGGPLEEGRAFVWRPFIPRNTNVRLFIPDLVAAKVEVRVGNVFGEAWGVSPNKKTDWKLLWSLAESDSSVLSPEFKVGNDLFDEVEVRVISNKNLTVGVSNIMVIAPNDPAQK